jgi:hypothetical protein
MVKVIFSGFCLLVLANVVQFEFVGKNEIGKFYITFSQFD